MCLLLRHQLPNWQGKILPKCVGIGFFGSVFALLGCLQQGMVSAAQLCFQIAPHPVESPRCRAGLLDVMDAVLVKHLFQVASEARALQRFSQEIALQRLVLQMFADIGKALLAVQESVDQGVEGMLHFVLSSCVCGHENLNYFNEIGGDAVGAGSAGCARFASAGGKREKSRKSRAPANR